MLRRTGSLALLLVLALAGCSDDGDDGDGGASGDGDREAPEETTSTAAADAGGDAGGDGECAFLTAETVSSAVGTAMTTTAAGPQTCFFGPVDAASEWEVVVNEVPLAIDAQSYAEQARTACEGEVIEVDVPDAVDAYACTAFTTQGFLYVDGDSVVIDVDGAPDDAAGLQVAATLLPEVTLG